MAWSWRYEDASGRPVELADPELAAPPFPSQADAESWIGETWRELLASGVHQVVLLDGGREVYGPMGLNAP